MIDRPSPRRAPTGTEKRADLAPASPLQPLRLRPDAIVLAGCLLSTLLALGRVCVADFTTWDDPQTVAKNPWLRAADNEAFTHFWSHPYMDLYIPVTYDVWAAVASGAIEEQPGGPALNPHAFHAANLVIHLIATALVYALLRRHVGPLPAAAGTLLFGLHPVQVEPVAWVSGMKDVLCGMLMLAALLADPLAALPSASGAASDAPRSKKPGRLDKNQSSGLARYVAATLLFVLAMLAKPTAMVLPAVVLVLAWAIAGLRLTVTSREPAPLKVPNRAKGTIALNYRSRKEPRPALSRGRQALLWLTPWFVLSLACAAWTSRFQSNPQFVDSPLWLRPLVALHALGFYAVKVVSPIHLAVDYGRSPAWLRQHPGAGAMGLIPIALTALLFRLRKRAPLIVAAGVIFVIGLAPLLGLAKFDFQFFSTVADHYLYLPMFGAALALAVGVAAVDRWAKRMNPPVRVPIRNAVAALMALALVALGVRTWFQTGYWRDTRALFDHTLEVNPYSVAALIAKVRFSLKAHQAQAAEQYARRAVAVQPRYTEAIVGLGSALAMQGREDEAMEQFRHALDVSPASPDAMLNLGVALANKGRFAEAQTLFAIGIQQDPENALLHLQLGHVLADQNQPMAAQRELELAIRLDPQNAEAHANLGWVLAGYKEIDRARDEFAAALVIDPNLPAAITGIQYCESAKRLPQH